MKRKFIQAKHETLKELVERRLRELDVSQREIERLSNKRITQPYLSQITRDSTRINPGVEKIKVLSEVLDVPVDEVFHAALRTIA